MSLAVGHDVERPGVIAIVDGKTLKRPASPWSEPDLDADATQLLR